MGGYTLSPNHPPAGLLRLSLLKFHQTRNNFVENLDLLHSGKKSVSYRFHRKGAQHQTLGCNFSTKKAKRGLAPVNCLATATSSPASEALCRRDDPEARRPANMIAIPILKNHLKNFIIFVKTSQAAFCEWLPKNHFYENPS